MVVHEDGSRIYSLCRLPLSNHLFYRTAEDATSAQQVENAKKKKQGGWPSMISSCKRLPAAAINFSAPPSSAAASNMHFFSLLREQGEDCVMFADPCCNTSVYDASTKSVRLTHQSYFSKPYNSIALSIRSRCSSGNVMGREDDHGLYVLSTLDGSFELFNYCRIGKSAFLPSLYNRWYWSPLPSAPPCLGYHQTTRNSPLIVAAAVVDNCTICASFKNGTYNFDTSTEVWSHAGSWVLPFYRAAEYVPELSLWFGLQAPGTPRHSLCAFDLSASAMMMDSAAPSSLHTWDYLDGLPDEWSPVDRALVNLGSGRFCIATYFTKKFSCEEEVGIDVHTVLTGVEVVRCGDGLQMIKHKSERYNIKNTIIQCVL